MKYISLLPIEYKKYKSTNRKMNIAMVAAGIFTAVVVFTFVIVKIMVTIPETELQAMKAQSNMLLRQIDIINDLTNLEKELKKLGNRAQEAVGNQPDWPALFVDISSSAPEGVQIKNLNANNGEDDCILTITGSAREYTDVSLWMERMKESEKILEVQLKYSRVSGSDPVTEVSFEFMVSVSNAEDFRLFEEADQ